MLNLNFIFLGGQNAINSANILPGILYGSVISDGYPHYLPHNLFSYYQVNLPLGYTMTLRFPDVGLGYPINDNYIKVCM